MNKIEKFLAKLDSHKRLFVLELMYRIKSGDLSNLNIKKLEGHDNLFRLKKGYFRIIFSKNSDEINIVSVDKRSEKTYRDF